MLGSNGLAGIEEAATVSSSIAVDAPSSSYKANRDCAGCRSPQIIGHKECILFPYPYLPPQRG